MILDSFGAEHNAVFLVAEKLDRGDLTAEDADEFIHEAINIHFRDEEQILFPELAPARGAEVAQMLDDHEQIRSAYAHADGSSEADMARILRLLMDHCEEEERVLYADAEEILGRERLKALQGLRKECSCCGHYE